MAKLTLTEAHALALGALIKAGTSKANATAVADALVAAEADGIPSHGLSRVAAYSDQVKARKVVGDAVPALTRTAPAALMVDAAYGFAFPAIARGLAEAKNIVRETGVMAMGVTDSHHFGAAGYHVEPLAKAGLIALAFGNSPAAIAPWGGSKGIFGTNPIAFACPRRMADGSTEPLVIDLSLSKVARGKIMVAAQKGETIEAGWALDAAGKPTTDAKAALGGTMLPMGDAKGAALVLMVEILAASLVAANHGYEASSFFDDKGGPPRVGQFFIVIDPLRFGGTRAIDRVGQLCQAMLDQPGTRLPGARRFQARAKAAKEGITVADALLADLKTRAGI